MLIIHQRPCVLVIRHRPCVLVIHRRPCVLMIHPGPCVLVIHHRRCVLMNCHRPCMCFVKHHTCSIRQIPYAYVSPNFARYHNEWSANYHTRAFSPDTLWNCPPPPTTSPHPILDVFSCHQILGVFCHQVLRVFRHVPNDKHRKDGSPSYPDRSFGQTGYRRLRRCRAFMAN